MKAYHKPTIETIINTTAIALTAAGTVQSINREWYGIVLIMFGVFLEFFKYFGRQRKLW